MRKLLIDKIDIMIATLIVHVRDRIDISLATMTVAIFERMARK